MFQKVMETWLKAKISNPVTDEMTRDGNALMTCADRPHAERVPRPRCERFLGKREDETLVAGTGSGGALASSGSEGALSGCSSPATKKRRASLSTTRYCNCV